MSTPAPNSQGAGRPTQSLAEFQSQLGDPSAPAPAQRPQQQARAPQQQQPNGAWPGDLPPSADDPAQSDEPMALDDDQQSMEDALSQQEPPPGAETDEDGQPIADPLDEELHGVKARELLEALKQGKLPDSVFDKLQFEVRPNNEPRMVTLKEALSGYMRQADYTRGKQEVADGRRGNEEFMRGWEMSIEDMRGDPSGAKLRHTMRRLGLGEAFFKAAQAVAIEEHELSQLPPELAEARREATRLRQENEDREERLRALEQDEKAKRQSKLQERFRREMDELTPVAFQRAGLKEGARARKAYIDALGPLWRDNGRKLTMEICEQAAVAAKETLMDEARQFALEQGTAPGAAAAAMGVTGAQPTQQRPASPQPLPARRAAPAPAQQQRRGPQTGGTLEDARAYFRTLGSRV